MAIQSLVGGAPSTYNPITKSWSSTNLSLSAQVQPLSAPMAIPSVSPQRAGALNQFMYGITSPIVDTAMKLGGMEKIRRPAPVGLGENVAKIAGSILGFSAFLNPIVSGVTGMTMGALAPALAAVKYGPLLTAVTGGAISGSLIGAHQAWVDDQSIAKGAATGAVTNALFSAAGFGIGKAIQQAKIPTKLKPGLRTLRETSIGTKDTDKLLKTIDAMPEEKLIAMQNNLAEHLKRVDASKMPSWIKVTDVGIRITNSPNWHNLPAKERMTQLVNAFKDTEYVDTAFRPVFDMANAHVASELLTVRGSVANSIRRIMRATPAIVDDLPEGNLGDKLRSAKTLHEQYKAVNRFKNNINRSYRRMLSNYNVSTIDDVYSAINNNTALSDTEKAKKLYRVGQVYQKYIQGQATVQDMSWKIHGKIADVGKYGYVNPKKVSSTMLTKTMIKGTPSQVESAWDIDIQKFFVKVSEEKGQTINTFEKLSQIAPEYVDDFKNLVSRIRQDGKPVRAARIALTTFATDDDVIKDGYELIKNLDPAKIKDTPYTMAEELMLQQQMSPIARFTFPVRKIFGDAFMDSARESSRQQMIFRDTYMGAERGTVKWIEMLWKAGIRGDKAIQKSGNNIGKILENERLHEVLKKVVRATESSVSRVAKKLGVTKEELKIAAEMRFNYNELFARMNLDYEQYMKAYMPHIRKLSGKYFEELRVRLMQQGLDSKDITRVRWIHELSRQGNLINYETNAFKAYNAYVAASSKKLYLEPLFKEWTSAFNRLGMSPDRKMVFEQLKQYMLGRPSDWESFVDGAIKHVAGAVKLEVGNRPTEAISGFLAEMQYAGVLAPNPFSAIKNLTQKILVIPDLSDKNSISEGIANMVEWYKVKNTPLGKAISEMNVIKKDRIFVDGLNLRETAIERWLLRLGSPFGVTPSKAQKINRGLFSMFQWSDLHNVDDAFGAQMLRMLKKGAPVHEAAEIAKSTTMSTQFMYGLDSPMLYKSPFGKQIGIFMSWPLNWASMLYEQGTTGDMRKAIATVGLMAIGSEMLNLTGFNFRSTHPVEVARGWLPFALLEGEERSPMSIRAGIAGWQYLESLASGDPTAIDTAFDNFKNRIVPLIPLGLVTNRVVNFITVARNGWKEYDMVGRLRREVHPWEATRAAFGPTIEAQRRWEDWQQIQRMNSDYRRLRRIALNAYISGNMKRFEQMQERMYQNFGRFIEPQDIEYEMELREMTSLERQLLGLPKAVQTSFLAGRGVVKTEPVQLKSMR